MVGPLPADELAVPAQQRLRADDERGPTWARQNLAERGHEQPVSTAKTPPAGLALEHRELMAKDHDLDVVVQVAGRAGSQPECSAQQQVDEGEDHGADLLLARRPILRNALAAPTIAGFCALHGDLAEWHGLLLERLVGSEAEDRLDRLARHPALGGPELEFLQAQLAYQRGDVSSARGLVRAALQRLPGHQDFLDFASEIGAPLPPRAQQLIEERSPSAGSLPPRASNRLPSP